MSPHMKTNCSQTTRPVEIKTRNSSRLKIKPGPLILTLLLAGAILSGPGWGVQRCAAAGTGFPVASTNEPTQSAGVFKIVVDPSFASLFSPTPGYNSYYPGYSPASGVLTSPMLYQYQTWIGSSKKHVRNTNSPTYFPAQVGTNLYYPNISSYVTNYAQYAFIPPPFDTAQSGPGGVDEVFTEIQDLNMVGQAGGSTGVSNSACAADPRIPSIPNPTAAALVSVMAGPVAIPNLPSNLRSFGIVQQVTAGSSSDFQAQSFFDMFVRVTLPGITGTGSTNFPGGVNAQATLYNDASSPLIVENLAISNLPPTVAYNHSPGSTAVPIKFLTSNPPYWTAGEVLGYLTLAGHGVFSNAVTVSVCDRVTGPGGLLDLTLGTNGAPLPGAPVPWLRTDNSFPTPNSSYNSSVNTYVDPASGITNVQDDAVSFTTGSGTYSLRDFSLGSLNGSITPPLLNNASTYSATSVPLSLMVSNFDLYGDSDFHPSFGDSPVTMLITNGGPSGSTTRYATELQSMDYYLDNGLRLRESPTRPSLGKHTIQPDPRGFRVSSIYDVNLQLSDNDGATWADASRPLRVEASMPPAAPNSIYVTQTGTNAVLQWQGNFALQSTEDLQLPFTDVNVGGVVGGKPVTTGPYTNGMSGRAKFFRLRQ